MFKFLHGNVIYTPGSGSIEVNGLQSSSCISFWPGKGMAGMSHKARIETPPSWKNLSENRVMSIHLRCKQGQERRIKKGVPALTQGYGTQASFCTLPKTNVYSAEFHRTCPSLLRVNIICLHAYMHKI